MEFKMSYFAIIFDTQQNNYGRIDTAIQTVAKGDCQKFFEGFWVVNTIHKDAKQVRDYIKHYLKLDFDDKVFVISIKDGESPWASWGLDKDSVDWLKEKASV